MKRIALVSALVIVAVGLIGCKGKGRQSAVPGADGDTVVAVVGGEPITMIELDAAAASQLQKVQTEIYKIRKRALDELVEQKLLEQAAKKQGVTVDEYIAQEIDAKAKDPQEQETKALYDARKDRIGKSYDEVKDQLAAFMKRNRQAMVRGELIARLKQDAQVQMKLEPPRVEIDLEDAPVLGSKDADIVIVEFSDYQCPFCKRVRPTIWRLIDEHEGKIGYVFMDFPLSFHRDAQKAHEAAHCAGEQGKYFDFNKKLFTNQKAMKVDDLKKYAKELDLDTKQFNACLDEGKYADRVGEFMQRGVNAGVSGTPAFFINGIMLSGAQPYDAFEEIVVEELKR